MINPYKIKYQDIFSTELNMIDLVMCVTFGNDNGEMTTFLGREAIASESYDGRYRRVHGYKYNELFSPKFTFMKKGFGDFSMEDVRRVLKWLTCTSSASLLDVYYDDNDVVAWSAIGGWTEISTHKYANNRTVGITATFEAITPFAMSDLYTVTKTISSPTDNKIVINIDTDEPHMAVYPRIKIKQNGTVVRISSPLTEISDMVYDTVYYDGTYYYCRPKADTYAFKKSTTNPNLSTTSVKFLNMHTDFFNKTTAFGPTIVKNNTGTETVVLDGANKVVSSSNTMRIFGDDFVNQSWLPLYDGKNEITIEGNCTVTFEWREVRKIGEY